MSVCRPNPILLPCHLQTLDSIERTDRNPLAPVRLPVVDRWKEMGTIIMGKIESGFIRVGDVYQLMPNKWVAVGHGSSGGWWEGGRGECCVGGGCEQRVGIVWSSAGGFGRRAPVHALKKGCCGECIGNRLCSRLSSFYPFTPTPPPPPAPRLKVKVEAIWRDEKECNATMSGENLRLRVTGAEETDVSAGFVLSSIKNPVSADEGDGKVGGMQGQGWRMCPLTLC